MKNARTYLISLGHLVTDINQGALPALLPFLIAEQSLSYTAAAGLVFIANTSSSLIQPVFGYFADRLSRPILMPVGIFLAGLGMALMGLVHAYGPLLTCAAVSGIGIAAFHPEGARTINRIGGKRKATAMSLFAIGGNLGFALGPAIVTAAVLACGMRGTLFLILPVLVVSLWTLLRTPALLRDDATAAGKAVPAAGEKLNDRWMPFARLAGAVTCRSILSYGLNTFIPLYWVYVLNQSKAAGASSLTVMFAAGLVGTIIGGRMADRYGSRRVMIIGHGSLILAFPLFLMADNPLILTLLLVPIGLGLFAPFSPMVVLGQKYLPTRVGLASGVTLGLAISIGGVAAPVLGAIADTHGIRWAMTSMIGIPAVLTLLSYSLPKEGTAIPDPNSERGGN
jgi:MFS transporter, FSR family, fosmidomycin resistance protein